MKALKILPVIFSILLILTSCVNYSYRGDEKAAQAPPESPQLNSIQPKLYTPQIKEYIPDSAPEESPSPIPEPAIPPKPENDIPVPWEGDEIPPDTQNPAGAVYIDGEEEQTTNETEQEPDISSPGTTFLTSATLDSETQPPTELEVLLSIDATLKQFLAITILLLSVAVVVFILKAVWPLFSGAGIL